MMYLIDLCETAQRAAGLRYRRTQEGWDIVADSDDPALTTTTQAWPDAPTDYPGRIVLVFSRKTGA